MSKFESNEVRDRYYELKSQTAFARYFLTFVGCDMKGKDEIIGLKHSNICHKNGKKYNGFIDDLYFDWGKFNVKQTFGSSKNASEMMNMIVITIMSMLESKVVIGEDLLVLCMEYCRLFN